MGDTMRTPVAAGNWKMNLTRDSARKLVEAIRDMAGRPERIEIVVAPPATLVPLVAEWIAGSGIRLAGQNMHWEEKGALTGEISPLMLRESGCSHVIVGHSERRHVMGESDADVNRKVASAFGHGLVPILCVGEKIDEREAGKTIDVVGRQLAAGLDGLGEKDVGGLIVAYEPVWAIGTGRNATGEDAQAVHAFIRGWLRERFGDGAAGAARILYGGSVTPANVGGLIGQKDIDGTLVGGASLKSDTFLPIIQSSIKR
jgi:triosephosphate isomerase